MAATVHEKLEATLGDGEKRGMWAWTALRLLLGWSFLWAFLGVATVGGGRFSLQSWAEKRLPILSRIP